MASLGGKREGAGRKKGIAAITADKMRDFVVKEIAKKIPNILEAKFDLALGHKVLRKTPTGSEFVYLESPDGNALRYLLDQGIGKPKESVEISGQIKTLIVDF